MEMNKERLMRQLSIDEGRRNKLYKDTANPPKWTIGVGRNIEDRGLREDEIDLLLGNDIKEAEATARALVRNFDQLDDVRQEVVVNMAFNMGMPRLSGFKRFIAALWERNYPLAGAEMQDSAWYHQVGQRGVRLVYAMKHGAFK
jgi:lysozyme